MTESVAPQGLVATEDGDVSQKICISLSELLMREETIATRWDVLRVHTSGHELVVLKSGHDAFSRGIVRTLVIMLTAAHTAKMLTSMVELLLDLRAKLTYLEQSIKSPEALVQL